MKEKPLAACLFTKEEDEKNKLLDFVSFGGCIIPRFAFKAGAIFNDKVKELQELLPRYEYDNVFDDSKFRKRFPDFSITTCKQGIEQIKNEQFPAQK